MSNMQKLACILTIHSDTASDVQKMKAMKILANYEEKESEKSDG